MRPFAIPVMALALLAGAGCASRETIVVHSEPRVVAESEERLVLVAVALEDGSVSVRVWRERDRVLEEDYWKTYSTATRSSEAPQTADTGHGAPYGEPPPPCPGELSPAASEALGNALGKSLGEFFNAIAPTVRDATSIFRHHTPSEPWPPRELVTIRRRETLRKPGAHVFLAREDGSRAIDLGVQPAGGYLLDASQVERLGGTGARILVCDGKLSAVVNLEISR